MSRRWDRYYDRLEFWQRLHERLGRLGNRVDAADLGKVMAAVHERVPIVTPDEQRELRLKTAEEEARRAQSFHDMHAEAVTGQKGLIAHAQVSVSQGEAAMVACTGKSCVSVFALDDPLPHDAER